ncbi:MAG TPA: mechanosensitive ion channel family protein [Geobacteraceae bacterium]|nr:mechanosensitive ion channel family protein [Geobacteraceae bacterium]
MKRAAYLTVIMLAVLITALPFLGATDLPPAKEALVKEALPATAPVMLGRTAIFSIPGFHALGADERAAKISERLEKIADDPAIRTDAIKTDEGDVSTDIEAGDRAIMAVYDSDARPFGVSRQELATACADKIRLAIQQYRQARLPQNVMHGIVLAVIATAVLLAVLLLVFFLFRRALAAVEKGKTRSIQFQRFEVLRLDQVKALLTGSIRGVRLIVVLLIFYIYAHFLLGCFPWTSPFSGQILNYLLVPLKTMKDGFIGYIPDLIFLVVLAVVARYLLKFMRLFAVEVEKGNIAFPGFYREWAKPTYKIARFLVIAFVAVVAFPYFPGSQSPAFKGISIFLGVLFSLGSSSTVSNVVAGLDMTYRRAFLIGDWIKIGELTGEVTRMRLLVSHLRTYKNEEVIIPNSVIQNSHVTNYSSLAREQGLILHTSITIGYSTPWRQVHAFLLEAAAKTPGLLREPAPFVLQTALDDFYVRYELNAYTDEPREMLNIYSDLHQNIQDAFNEFEVQIMSPHYMFDPEAPAIVPKERWYEPPAKPPREEGGEKTRYP